MRIQTLPWYAVLLLGGLAACKDPNPPGTSPDGGTGGQTFQDFPAEPIVESGAPAEAPTMFSGATPGSDAGPCIAEPEPGTLYPRNWLRPRFGYSAPGEKNLFEIRVHAPRQANDLVVYTTRRRWTMPDSMWRSLAEHVHEQSITVTVRAGTYDGQRLSGVTQASTSDFTIAPTSATGTIVYWTTSSGSALKGFRVGGESVYTVLEPSQVQMRTSGGASVTCIGCHTSTPGGEQAGFTAQAPWGNALASLKAGQVGQQPAYLGPGAVAALGQAELGIQTFSRAHWKPGDRIEIAPFGKNLDAKLAWFDLEAQTSQLGTAYGFLARNGDPRGVGSPSWSHDGSRIVYVSTTSQFTGRLGPGHADLYSVPYNNRQGGDATPVPGAADPAWNEYYPAFSPDDQLLAFNRAPDNSDMYDQARAEVFVTPAGGGEPVRLQANDPPACSGRRSPGVTNSWPKWSPEVVSRDGKTYYWLCFSSKRTSSGLPQLYVTGVVVDRTGATPTITTHAALYLWNQPANEANHTPAWDVFQTPIP